MGKLDDFLAAQAAERAALDKALEEIRQMQIGEVQQVEELQQGEVERLKEALEMQAAETERILRVLDELKGSEGEGPNCTTDPAAQQNTERRRD